MKPGRLDRIAREMGRAPDTLRIGDIPGLIEPEVESGTPQGCGFTFEELWTVIDAAARELTADERADFQRFIVDDKIPADPSRRLVDVMMAELSAGYALALRVGTGAVETHQRKRGWR